MSYTTALPDEFTWITYPGGTYSLSREALNFVMPFRSKEEATRVARAILAALGEPVEAKSDRSELDKEEPWRWLVVESESGKKVERWMKNARIDDMISAASKRTEGAFTLYEAVAHVAAEPKPTERKVVRLD